MNISLPYGKNDISFSLPDQHILGVLEPSSLPPCADVPKSVRLSLHKPIAGLPFPEVLEKCQPQKIAIIVNDLTRSTPTAAILPPVLQMFEQANIARSAITIIIATGTHRGLTDAEMKKVVGESVFDSYQVLNHNCDAPDLYSFGKLSTGNELLINRIVAKSDFRLAIGEVLFHYYAGFAGGRKSILPGVAGRSSIMQNHMKLMKSGAGIGLLDGNPVHEEMKEALDLCPLHFIVNVVLDSQKRVVRVVSGHPVEAWLEGVQTFRKLNTCPIPQKAEVVIASAGGFPKDINMYQAHKALEMAVNAIHDGGTLILASECKEGFGHPVFEEWAKKDLPPEQVIAEIKADFRFGAHLLYFMAQLASKSRLCLYTSLNEKSCKQLYCNKITSLERVLESLYGRYGRNFKAYIIPQGGIVLPVLESA